jgi:hypothetical protein
VEMALATVRFTHLVVGVGLVTGGNSTSSAVATAVRERKHPLSLEVSTPYAGGGGGGVFRAGGTPGTSAGNGGGGKALYSSRNWTNGVANTVAVVVVAVVLQQ